VADCVYDTANDQMGADGYTVLLAYLAEIANRADKNNLPNLPIAKQIKYMAYGQIATDLYLSCRSQLVPQTALNESCRTNKIVAPPGEPKGRAAVYALV
jgi:hypothetical protein